jgi:hypothetical protein
LLQAIADLRKLYKGKKAQEMIAEAKRLETNAIKKEAKRQEMEAKKRLCF